MQKKHTPIGLCAYLALLTAPLASSGQTAFPYDTRSDSISISHYDIRIDVRDAANATLKGHTTVVFEPLVNGISEISLDLLALAVDSVKAPGGGTLSYTIHPGGFTVNLGSTFNIGNVTSVDVYYKGVPVEDPVFGGFIFDDPYKYNLGVSLTDVPHNYGKAWFPCFDNFITRSTFDLYVTSLPEEKAICGGTLQSEVVNDPNSKTSHWKIKQPIPTYLVGTAVADYELLEDSFISINNDTIPVLLAARAEDTTNLINSFVNLESAFNIFESKWGAFSWDRVGYSILPNGAMEHAMNIAYPSFAIDPVFGPFAFQGIMAHELSHNWWGNLVTARTAEDMWINEGSASYNEFVFLEELQGRSTYDFFVRRTHEGALHLGHIQDGGYWPLSGMPQYATYGVTTYNKGALMIHNLRTYLGDKKFFGGLQTLLEENKFSDIDAVEYRDKLASYTGINLDNFFADWIFQGGWPHISIDSVKLVGATGSNYAVKVYLKQKLVGRTNYSHQVPMTLTLRDNAFHTYEASIVSDGQNNNVTVIVPFIPSVAYLNRDEMILHAVNANYAKITAPGQQVLDHGRMTLNVQSVVDSAFVVVEHNWAAADPVTNPQWTISPQRFWRVDGIFPTGFSTNATIAYNGQFTAAGFLDDQLINDTENNLILLYRPNRATAWTEYKSYTKVTGASLTDKRGTININQLQKGEYALAMQHPATNAKSSDVANTGTTDAVTIKIHPNPATDIVNLESTDVIETLVIMDMQGQLVYQNSTVNAVSVQVNTSEFAQGNYLVSGYAKGERLFTEKITIQK